MQPRHNHCEGKE